MTNIRFSSRVPKQNTVKTKADVCYLGVKMANEEIVRRNRLGKIIRNLKFETRTYLKEMAGFRCAICKEVSSHLEVDHIRPLWDGGTDELENLQVLCYECHKEKSREEHHRWSKLNPVLIIRVTNGN